MRFPRRAILACLPPTIFSACAPTPATPQTSPPADTDVFGLWAVPGGAYVEVSAGIADRTFDLVVHSHPLRSIHDIPSCVAYDVPLGSREIECRVALERCVQALTLKRAGEALVVHATAPRPGPECGKSAKELDLTLRKADQVEAAIDVYLAALREEPRIGSPPLDGLKSLEPSPREALRTIADLLQLDAPKPIGVAHPTLAALVESIGVAHRRLLAQCGAVPPTHPCDMGKARAIVRAIFDNPEMKQEADEAAQDLRRGEAYGWWKAPVGRRNVDGVWLGPYASAGASSGYVGVEYGDKDSITIQFGESLLILSLDDLDAMKCQAHGGLAYVCDACKGDEPCARTVNLELVDDRLIVSYLGAGWRTPDHPDRSSVGRYYYSLHRADPFLALVRPYLGAIQRESGHGMEEATFATMPGSTPEDQMRALAIRVRDTYKLLGQDASSLSLKDAWLFVTLAEARLALRCGPWRPEDEGPPDAAPPRCSAEQLTSAIREGVEFEIARKKNIAHNEERSDPPTVPTSPAPPPASTGSSAPEARVDVDYILIAFKGATRAPAAVTRTKDEARRRAAEVCKKAKAGTDFASLARQYSDDKQVYLNFARGAVVKPFGDAAFSLTPGSVSPVVEADYGFFVIKRRR